MKPQATKINKKDKSLPAGVSKATGSGFSSKHTLVYGISCHYLPTLDHSKYTWAKSLEYTLFKEAWLRREDCEKVCKVLEKTYKDWMFWPEIHFFENDAKDVKIYNRAQKPSWPLVDIAEETKKIKQKLKKQ